jgi:hypothetical protein
MYTEKHCNFSNIVYSILNSLTVINERDLFNFELPEYDFSHRCNLFTCGKSNLFKLSCRGCLEYRKRSEKERMKKMISKNER